METHTIDGILKIAERESGSEVNAADKMETVLADSLDWVAFVQCVRNEIGPIDDDKLIGCETFQDLANAYALPN